MKNKIHNYKHLEKRRKELRNNPTSAESFLWKYLQQKKLDGKKFRRQHSITNYIVDFYCKPLNLVVEIDGDSHNNKYDSDLRRQKELEKLGLFFLRFDDKEVKQDINNVLRTIEGWIDAHKKNPPSPL